MIVFLVLGVVMYKPLQAVGIAASNTVAYALQAGLLFFFLRKEFENAIVLWPTMLRGMVAALLGAGIAFGILYFRSGFIFAILAFLVGMAAAALVIRRDLKELNSL